MVISMDKSSLIFTHLVGLRFTIFILVAAWLVFKVFVFISFITKWTRMKLGNFIFMNVMDNDQSLDTPSAKLSMKHRELIEGILNKKEL